MPRWCRSPPRLASTPPRRSACSESDAYAEDVRADLQRGAMFGIRGVPFFVLNEQLGVSGGQEQAVFLSALEQAWATANPLKMVDTATDDSMVCEDDSCAVAPTETARVAPIFYVVGFRPQAKTDNIKRNSTLLPQARNQT